MGLFHIIIRAIFRGYRSNRRNSRRDRARAGPAASGVRARNPRERVDWRAESLALLERARIDQSHAVLKGRCWVIDGDTIVIGNLRIRIAGIDAPELDHPWGMSSKWAVVRMCKGQVVTAHIRDELSYGRVVADCYLPDGRNIAEELVKCGLALDWPIFSGGRYLHLEPPGVRKKLWRSAQRQKADNSTDQSISGE